MFLHISDGPLKPINVPDCCNTHAPAGHSPWSWMHSIFFFWCIHKKIPCRIVNNVHAFINNAESQSVCNMLKAQRWCIVQDFLLFNLFYHTNHVWSKYVLHSIILFIYSDVGMIMMQTGMVKQGLNSTSHTYIDGMNKRIQKKKHTHIYCWLHLQEN